MHRVFLVDDHPVMREGIRTLVERAEDLSICGEAVDASGALDALNGGVSPDLLVLDLSLPGMSGLDLLKHVRGLHPSLPVLVLSAHDESVYADRVVRAGAQGYLSKHSPSEEILSAMREVLNGGMALSENVRERMMEAYADGQDSAPIERLSDRELEVFEHIGHGRATTVIADAMCISPKTVESHRLNIKKKMGVDTANQLVQRAAVWVNTKGLPPASKSD